MLKSIVAMGLAGLLSAGLAMTPAAPQSDCACDGACNCASPCTCCQCVEACGCDGPCGPGCCS